MLKQQRNKPPLDSLSDRLYRNRGVLLVVSVPLALICLVLLLMPGSRDGFSAGRKVSPVAGGRKYAVVFDAGSSGSRVHVFCFDRNLDLVPIGNGLELFEQGLLGRKVVPVEGRRKYAVVFDAESSGSRVHVFSFDLNLDLVPIGKDLELFELIKPGLSAYAKNPKAAAESLQELLVKAQNVVPKKLQKKTPVRVGATAGLRQLEGDASDKILEAVRDFLKEKSPLNSMADSVTVLDGTQEGAYQWVTINYLLGKLGKRYSDTVGVVDLGGGSVQMAYAISEADAAKAPRIQDGEDTYVKEMYLKGTKYYLYVHSYLHYGLLAARAEILKVEDSGSPCIMMGYQGSYKYGGTTFPATAPPSGSSVEECRRVAFKALKGNESTCTHIKCTFSGVWNGGGGDGQKNLFVASFFFDRAAQAGFVNPDLPVAKVRPVDFEREAKRACQAKFEDAKAIYPHVEEDDLPYLCMDLVYQYTLLVDGFGLDPWQQITLVKKVEYQNSLVEAAWPLGSAIEVVSSLK